MLQDPHNAEEAQQPQHADEADTTAVNDAPRAIATQ
jgi:hypothetical protein